MMRSSATGLLWRQVSLSSQSAPSMQTGGRKQRGIVCSIVRLVEPLKEGLIACVSVGDFERCRVACCRSTAPRMLVRFVFCKTDEKLNTACEQLRTYFKRQ